MAKKVVIDSDECIGCESCVELCAEVFSFNEDEEKAEGKKTYQRMDLQLTSSIIAFLLPACFTASSL